NANYAQRAGRAGRSKDSVAFIMSFAAHNSHDQIYFTDPIPMIEGRVEPPYFKLDNKKISIRHALAFIISYFYRSIPIASTIKNFIDDGYSELIKFIKLKKDVIESEIQEIFDAEIS